MSAVGRFHAAPGERAGPRDRLRHRVWLCLLVVACGDRESGEVADPASAVMPRIVGDQVEADQRRVGSVLSAVAIGSDGAVLVLPEDSRGPSLALIGDRDGVRREYGALGEGPGEMRMPIPLLLDDTVVVGYDLATQRVMVYDRQSTRIRRELRLVVPVVPFMRGPGATLLATRSERGVDLPALVDIATGRVRSVITPSDSHRITMFADDDQHPGGTWNTPVIGRWGNGVALANGMTYRVAMYDREGLLRHHIDRHVAPRRLTTNEIELELSRLANTPIGRTPERLARARERLEATPTRWFTQQGPPRSDAKGRLWVVVEHGDSTSADVYAADRLLGRIRLDCPGYSGRWDLFGEWLVLLCIPADPTATHDAEVRRWRIVE